MNDAEALAEIRAALDLYFRGQTSPYEALNRIAQITGANTGAE